MSDVSVDSTEPDDDDDGPDLKGLVVSALIVALFGLLWFLNGPDAGKSVQLGFLFLQVAVISVVIWQACDPFADAAQWIGQTFKLPGSVRGATLDAVASSMPELFSGIFFVIVAMSAADKGNVAAQNAAAAEGYGSTIATCAGSAVYNMILIPAFCALVISFRRKHRPTIDIDDEVISRDGLWFVGCELLLILFLFNESMSWWMGLVFIGMYGIYIWQLYCDAQEFRTHTREALDYITAHPEVTDNYAVMSALHDQGHRVTLPIVEKAREERLGLDSDEETPPDDAGLFFGYLSIPLNGITAGLIIFISTIVAAIACFYLVQATLGTAELLAVPAFFVAVILAAAASSVPDTFLAIGAARRGDDSGAVSNAFGSNIFDICICLSIPLLVNSYLNGWQPVSLMQDGKPIPGLVGLRILLVVLTLITLAIMWHNRQLTRGKALVLCGLYLIFVGYAVMGSLKIMF